MLIGSIGCGITQLLFGIFYADSSKQDYQIVSVVMMTLVICFFAISYGPVLWTYLGEVMHPKTMIFPVCALMISTILVAAITPAATKSSGKSHSILFYIYGAIMGVSFVVCLIFMKETKGKSVEEI